MKKFREQNSQDSCFIISIFIVVFLWVAGCTTTRHDPLAGWNFAGLAEIDANASITNDYHAYIEQLPPEERKGVGPIQFYSNDTGGHAVRIEIAMDGTDWGHVLIYDRQNKRIKVVKYIIGHYSS
jgi:hypothetical protein